jgi:hypothetical protein
MSAHSGPSLGNGGEWIILNIVKRNPEGLLLLAAGVVLMMRTGSSRPSPAVSTDAAYGHTRGAAESASKVAETVTDTLNRTVGAASSYASTISDTAHQTMDAAKSYASSAAEYADQARRAAGEQSDRVVRAARNRAQAVLQNQPLAIVAAGLAAGAALAAALPPTELERETLGPVGDQMSKAADRVGDQLRQATVKAGEKLKSAAEERGLNPEGLKEVAGEVADTFKASMRGESKTTDSGPAVQSHAADRSK